MYLEKWHVLEYGQQLIDGKYTLYIKMDGTNIYTKVNTHPQVFESLRREQNFNDFVPAEKSFLYASQLLFFLLHGRHIGTQPSWTPSPPRVTMPML